MIEVLGGINEAEIRKKERKLSKTINDFIRKGKTLTNHCLDELIISEFRNVPAYKLNIHQLYFYTIITKNLNW